MAKAKLETTFDDEDERNEYVEAVKELGVSAAEDLREHARSVIRQRRMRQAHAKIAKLWEKLPPQTETGAETIRAVRDEYERSEGEQETAQ